MPPAWVRAGSIEGPVPSAALCEATTSAARSPSSLGVITASHRRFFKALDTLFERGVCGCARQGWQVSASGREASNDSSRARQQSPQCQRAAPPRSYFFDRGWHTRPTSSLRQHSRSSAVGCCSTTTSSSSIPTSRSGSNSDSSCGGPSAQGVADRAGLSIEPGRTGSVCLVSLGANLRGSVFAGNVKAWNACVSAEI